MNNIDDNGLFKRRFVSNLFEYASIKKECSSKVFVKAFVYSSIPSRIASPSFIFESIDVIQAYEIIKKEKILTRGNDVYPTFVMAWIGYIIEYFISTRNIPITLLYRNIKPEELYALYEAYHPLDNEVVVKRLVEEKNMETNLNDVELYKRI